MNTAYYIVPSSEDLQHHGVLGMKWGIRRYQNKDGSLTNRGKRRLGIGNNNGVSGKRYKAANTNKSGTSKRENFTDYANLKEVNKMLKDNDNCSLCTFAFDLRNRGIDVRAGGTKQTNDGKTHQEIASWYRENRQFSHNNKYDLEFNKNGRFRNSNGVSERLKQYDSEFKKGIISEGNGTSGHLTLQYTIPDELRDSVGLSYNIVGGHDVFYKVEDGEVYIYDAQSGEKKPFDEYFYEEDSDIPVEKHVTAYLRTDDLTPNVDAEQTSNNGRLVGYKEATTKVAEPTVSASSNYSPPTTSTINTKPLDYSPPYKSKTEMELFKEDLDNAVKKTKKSLKNAATNIKNGLNTFKNVASEVANVLLWAMI